MTWYRSQKVRGNCERVFWNRISLANRIENLDRQRDIDFALNYFHLALVITLLLGSFLLEYWHAKYCTEMNVKSVTVGDYSLLFYGLPYGPDFEGISLETILFNEFRKKGYSIKSISFIFYTNEYVSTS